VTDRPSVLFACVHNSGRSVAAAALARHLAGDSLDVRSAGSDPGAGVNPGVAQVLAERGLPVDGHVPTRLDRSVVAAADVVVTMGCGDACPYVPGKRYVDWDLPDPKGRPIAEVRATRDEIARRVGALVGELDAW
jgi:arsenate reductase